MGHPQVRHPSHLKMARKGRNMLWVLSCDWRHHKESDKQFAGRIRGYKQLQSSALNTSHLGKNCYWIMESGPVLCWSQESGPLVTAVRSSIHISRIPVRCGAAAVETIDRPLPLQSREELPEKFKEDGREADSVREVQRGAGACNSHIPLALHSKFGILDCNS
jgi:hypothetical protein